ncbi:MAG: hypothetical protein GXP48_12735 [Acidobacteria bacterium]|nr:hypothetical protein [Acidobacteriota bacterium]
MADIPPPPVPTEPVGAGAGATEAPIAALPWETPGEPFFDAFFETLKLFIIRPSEAFARMRRSGDLGRPILYAIFLGWAGVIVSQLYSLALRGMTWRMLPGMQQFQGIGMSAALTIFVMILAPVFVLIGLFIWAGIVHLMLLILSGANEGFDATFRVMSYATTAQIAQIVPLCGGFAGGVWALVLEIIGIAKAHRISQGKAALAVLLPLVFCCACLAGLFALSGAAIVTALSHAAGQMK